MTESMENATDPPVSEDDQGGGVMRPGDDLDEHPADDAAEDEPSADDAEPDDEDDEDTEDPKPKSREQRYRQERNAARAEVEELQQQVSLYQSMEVLRLAGDRLADASDLVLFADIDDMLTEHGMVDPEKVTAAVEELLAKRPGLQKGARPPAPPSFAQGNRGAPAKAATWQQVFRGG
jgi:hypothetical protein